MAALRPGRTRFVQANALEHIKNDQGQPSSDLDTHRDIHKGDRTGRRDNPVRASGQRRLMRDGNEIIEKRRRQPHECKAEKQQKPETDEANLAMPVVGRNQLSGLPRTQEIHAAEIYEALKDPVAALIGSIQDVLVRTPPQLASDIFDDGIVLSGGAAGLARLPEAIYTALHIPCGVADDPQTSVVLGCGIAVEDPGAYASLLDDGRKGFKRL